MKKPLGLGSYAVIVTVVVHTGLAIALSTIDEKKPTRPTEITLREVAPKKKPTPPPPTPPVPTPEAVQPAPTPAPPPPKPAQARKAAPAAAQAPSAPAAPAAPADFGLKMGNGGGNGPAVAAPAAPAAPAEPAPAKPPQPKTLTAEPAPGGGCTDPIVKPKPLSIVQPAFTQDAQDAGITGKVRVEITISAAGVVTAARVIEGLGHGLDEAALEAAKQSTFSPATKCGEPVETTFTIGMRFQH